LLQPVRTIMPGSCGGEKLSPDMPPDRWQDAFCGYQTERISGIKGIIIQPQRWDAALSRSSLRSGTGRLVSGSDPPQALLLGYGGITRLGRITTTEGSCHAGRRHSPLMYSGSASAQGTGFAFKTPLALSVS
jgi:hypothetical protein